MRVRHGDCRDVMLDMLLDGEQFDAVVTDPPYDLTSTVERFGKPGSAPAKDATFARMSKGFMGKQWDGTGVAFDPATWQAVLAVMKPGAHLLAFGGSRTFHRMACAIEDAGFELRDTILWLYGTGFPKSLDVSKAIDKAAGAVRTGDGTVYGLGHTGVIQPSEPATPEAARWAGWGTALKPAFEPVIVARKPLGERTVAANVLAYGTGALNIDACRVELNGDYKSKPNGRPSQTGLEDNYDPARANVADTVGRFPANVLHDGSDEVEAAFAVYGQSKSQPHDGDGQPLDTRDAGWGFKRMAGGFIDSGTAARFFYSAKAGRADRAESRHPTVKPLALMRYLCKLVTPPGGTVLDPFAGSGTTLQAALECGFNAVGIEREAEYIADIERRLLAYYVA